MTRRGFLAAAGLLACGTWAVMASPPPDRGRKPKPTTTTSSTTTTTLPPGGGYSDTYADIY